MSSPPPRWPSLPPLSELRSHLHPSDLKGLAQLAIRGTLGVTGLAEKVQGNVYKTVAAPFGAAGRAFVDRAAGASGVKKAGITGLVYGSVKGLTRLAGGAVDTVLSQVAARTSPPASSPQREAMLAVLNGVLGDQLLDTGNPLAITMTLRHEGQSLQLDKAALAQRLPQATGKILLLVHGLCMNDLQWRGEAAPASGHDHATRLARELGYTPVYLHYNSGLHTAVNGGQFAALLEGLINAWPQSVETLSLLTHSMGGLVARGACHSAAAGRLQWLGLLKHLIFLGTPHHGSPLEKVGNWVDTVLGSNPMTRPFAKIGQIRSAGITDLRYGNVLTSSCLVNGKEIDRFEHSPDSREPLPLPAGVNCYAVAATKSSAANPVKDALIGDGLVPLRSAFGQHDEARHCLNFPIENQWTAYATHHMDLLKRTEVTARVAGWLGR